MWKELLARLTSRKLWIAIGSFILFVTNEQYSEALLVVLTYLGIEGGADVASRLKSGTNSTQGLLDALARSREVVSDDDDDFSAIDGKGRPIVSGRQAFLDDDDMDRPDEIQLKRSQK